MRRTGKGNKIDTREAIEVVKGEGFEDPRKRKVCQ